MSKMRVYELAKEFGIENKEFIAKLKNLGIAVKSHSSTLEDSEVERVRREFAAKGEKEVVEKRVKSTVIRRRAVRLPEEAAEAEEAAEPEEAAAPEAAPVEKVEKEEKSRDGRETGEAARAEGGRTAGGCGASRCREGARETRAGAEEGARSFPPGPDHSQARTRREEGRAKAPCRHNPADADPETGRGAARAAPWPGGPACRR